MTLPKMTGVESTNIEAVGHDGNHLFVRFKGGAVYRYPYVSSDHHVMMLAAESPGGYFHQHIKSKHKGEKLAEGMKTP